MVNIKLKYTSVETPHKFIMKTHSYGFITIFLILEFKILGVFSHFLTIFLVKDTGFVLIVRPLEHEMMKTCIKACAQLCASTKFCCGYTLCSYISKSGQNI